MSGVIKRYFGGLLIINNWTVELNTITYGTVSVPYFACKCLIQLSKENADSFPITSGIIARDFYIDDMLTGSDLKNYILQIQKEVSDILSGADFELM